jgi:hypothetical protein
VLQGCQSLLDEVALDLAAEHKELKNIILDYDLHTEWQQSQTKTFSNIKHLNLPVSERFEFYI